MFIEIFFYMAADDAGPSLSVSTKIRNLREQDAEQERNQPSFPHVMIVRAVAILFKALELNSQKPDMLQEIKGCVDVGLIGKSGIKQADENDGQPAHAHGIPVLRILETVGSGRRILYNKRIGLKKFMYKLREGSNHLCVAFLVIKDGQSREKLSSYKHIKTVTVALSLILQKVKMYHIFIGRA